MGNHELLTLKYDRLLDDKETKLAWCFIFANVLVYLPKSQVEDIRETVKEVDVPRWIVEAKGLEGYEV